MGGLAREGSMSAVVAPIAVTGLGPTEIAVDTRQFCDAFPSVRAAVDEPC